MELKKLLFSNPIFHDGINVTVRNGYKWAGALGEIVEVIDVELAQKPEPAHVLGVLTTKLNKIPESILEQEHDPACRTPKGILQEMQSIYGDDLQEDAPVTVLFFEFGEAEEFEVDVCVEVDIDMTDEEFAQAATLAHEQDITLNQLINNVIAEFAANPDLIKIATKKE